MDPTMIEVNSGNHAMLMCAMDYLLGNNTLMFQLCSILTSSDAGVPQTSHTHFTSNVQATQDCALKPLITLWEASVHSLLLFSSSILPVFSEEYEKVNN